MKNLIIGAARSGLAAAEYLLNAGQEVVLSDMDPSLAAGEAKNLAGPNFSGIWGRQPQVKEICPDRVIMSPGVPMDISPVRESRALGIPVISETELAFQEASCRFIAITGTNGKTTTTSWTAELLKAAGRRVVSGGNIGAPLISQIVGLGPEDLVVAEMSSFQLESVDRFRPDIAAILNISPDHLDRHKSMSAYVEAKSHVFSAQGIDDILVLNACDPILRNLATKASSQIYWFSHQGPVDRGIFIEDGELYYRLSKGGEARALLPCSKVALAGVHNLENAMASALIALLAKQSPEEVAQGLSDFKAIAHRLEPVAEIAGVRYINDSKGTNPDATEKALTAFTGPLWLILGGHSKGVDLMPLAERIKNSEARVLVQGESAQDFIEAFERTGDIDYRVFEDLRAATTFVKSYAQAGETVLLSPACSSYDQFENYEARGRAFTKWVTDDAD